MHQYNSNKSSMSLMLWDLKEGARQWRTWWYLGSSELITRFERSFIGLFGWNVISFGLFCLAIMLLFGEISDNSSKNFGASVVSGFLVYTLLSGLVTDSCAVFNSNAQWLKSVHMPYGIFVYKTVLKQFIVFLLSCFSAGIILIANNSIVWSMHLFMLLPALVIILLNGIASCLFLGTINARYRDVGHLVNTIMRFALFVTPILWQADSGGLRGTIAKFNPFTYYIDIFRAPLIKAEVSATSWLVVICITFVFCLISISVYTHARKKVIYWL